MDPHAAASGSSEIATRGCDEGQRFEPGHLVAGRYLLVELVGAGGMARVFRARDLLTERSGEVGGAAVALKIPHVGQRHPEALARLLREARLALKVSHPSVVQLRDVVLHEGLYALVMEYVGGQTLARRCRQQGSLALDEVLSILSQLCGALDAVHEAGLVHCDLKPANVQITPEGRVVLADFGIACEAEAAPAPEPADGDDGLADDQDTTPTRRSTSPSGTPAYMAPEQIAGDVLDRRTDVYALGVMLYELLTGEAPWQGATPSAVLLARFRNRPPDLREICPDLPVGVAQVVARCMAFRREERPDSAGEVIAALREALRTSLLGADASRPTRRVAPGAVFAASRHFGLSPSQSTLDYVEAAPA